VKGERGSADLDKGWGGGHWGKPGENFVGGDNLSGGKKPKTHFVGARGKIKATSQKQRQNLSSRHVRKRGKHVSHGGTKEEKKTPKKNQGGGWLQTGQGGACLLDGGGGGGEQKMGREWGEVGLGDENSDCSKDFGDSQGEGGGKKEKHQTGAAARGKWGKYRPGALPTVRAEHTGGSKDKGGNKGNGKR